MEQLDLPLETMNDIAMTRFLAFQEGVSCWVHVFGLKDWYVDFKHDQEGADYEALVEYDKETRHATFTFYSAGQSSSYSIERLALHEVLHLLFGDLIPEDCGDDVAREEHRVIERLLHVLL